MKSQIHQQKGFTLIEMIVVLILVGILASLAGLGIVAGVQGYMFSKNNAAISEKAQLALARINRELLECYNCSGTSGSVSMPILNPLGQRYFRLNAGNIEISDNAGFTYSDILINNVSSFTLTYSSDASNIRSIQVTMSLNHPDSGTPIAFSTNVYPRNSQ